MEQLFGNYLATILGAAWEQEKAVGGYKIN
jgi:hypothetical protein